MPVTEFALIKLKGGHDELEFLDVLMDCQEIQDRWMRRYQPHAVEGRKTHLSTMYIQSTGPPFLLITAPWDAPEAHTQWIESRENQSGFGKMSQYIAPGDETVLLFHMDPAGEESQLDGLFPSEGSLSVYRISVEPDQRDALQEKYQALEEEMGRLGPGHAVWAGWRIERSGTTEDMVIFSGSGVAEDRLRKFVGAFDNVDQRSFKHVV